MGSSRSKVSSPELDISLLERGELPKETIRLVHIPSLKEWMHKKFRKFCPPYWLHSQATRHLYVVRKDLKGNKLYYETLSDKFHREFPHEKNSSDYTGFFNCMDNVLTNYIKSKQIPIDHGEVIALAVIYVVVGSLGMDYDETTSSCYNLPQNDKWYKEIQHCAPDCNPKLFGSYVKDILSFVNYVPCPEVTSEDISITLPDVEESRKLVKEYVKRKQAETKHETKKSSRRRTKSKSPIKTRKHRSLLTKPRKLKHRNSKHRKLKHRIQPRNSKHHVKRS